VDLERQIQERIFHNRLCYMCFQSDYCHSVYSMCTSSSHVADSGHADILHRCICPLPHSASLSGL
jgi:hypothetical protein